MIKPNPPDVGNAVVNQTSVKDFLLLIPQQGILFLLLDIFQSYIYFYWYNVTYNSYFTLTRQPAVEDFSRRWTVSLATSAGRADSRVRSRSHSPTSILLSLVEKSAGGIESSGRNSLPLLLDDGRHEIWVLPGRSHLSHLPGSHTAHTCTGLKSAQCWVLPSITSYNFVQQVETAGLLTT